MTRENTEVRPGKWLVFAAVGSFFVTAVTGMTMTFVALPSIAEEFDVTLRTAGWVVVIYSLVISATLVPLGRMADLVGRRRVHLLGLALFGVGTLCVAIAPTFEALIAARAVMALGDAMAQSVGTGLLVSAFGPEERGKAIGSQTSSVAVGGAFGPLISGVLLAVVSWRVLFVVLAVLTAVSFAIGFRVLPVDRARSASSPRFDRVGALLSMVAIVGLVVVVNDPFEAGFGSPLVWAAAAGVVVAFAAFVRWERTTPAPMLDLGFFANPVFARGVVARVIAFSSATAVFILVPILLISVFEWNAPQVGVVMFLNSLGLGLSAQAAGRLSDRWGTRPFMIGGLIGLIATPLALASLRPGTPAVVIAVVVFASGVALGNWNVPNNATVIGTVGPADYGVVGAFTNLARNIGNVLGQALMVAVVAVIMTGRGFDIPLGDIADTPGADTAFLAGWTAAFIAMAVSAAVALAITLTIKPRPTSGTAATAAPR
ncbi:MAG: MFS transporter [Actinomycetota bacterium]